MFGSWSELSHPLLLGWAVGLVCESDGKADLLYAHFDSKQSRDPADQPFTCHPSPSLSAFAFRSLEVRWLVLDLYSMVAQTHWACSLDFEEDI